MRATFTGNVARKGSDSQDFSLVIPRSPVHDFAPPENFRRFGLFLVGFDYDFSLYLLVA